MAGRMANGYAIMTHDIDNFVTVHTALFREVFCHEYGKIPRHTGQNAITEGDLERILTKLLRTK